MEKIPDILTPATNLYPYWQNLGIQNPNMIPGHILAGEISDIGINRIPSETDFNNSDIRTIPTPGSPRQDVSASQKLQVHNAEMGRGAAVSLMDMFNQSMDTTTRIANNT